MATPDMPQKAPYPVAVEAGKSYWWCACGKSGKQRFIRKNIDSSGETL